MPFREKTAWITLVTILLFFAAYYGPTLSGLVPPNSWAAFHLAAICIVGLAAAQIIFYFIAASLSPGDARTPRDERERMIHARSHIVGYYVLMLGMAATLVATHLPFRGDHYLDVIVRTVNFGVFAMLLAAAAVAIAQIVMFRRGY